jgi:hypothetical protein
MREASPVALSGFDSGLCTAAYSAVSSALRARLSNPRLSLRRA